MTHLDERLTDFVFGELSAAEMDEARRHVADCAECRVQVEQFEHTRSMLRMSPDVDPPRRIVFEVEKPRALWRWLVPVAAAAAIGVAVLIAAPVGVQWHDSALTIAFGKMPAPQPTLPASVVVSQPAPQPVDYERIVNQLRGSDREWLVRELKMRDAAQAKEIARLRGDYAFLDGIQRSMYRETQENSASIQLLAQTKGGDSQD